MTEDDRKRKGVDTDLDGEVDDYTGRVFEEIRYEGAEGWEITDQIFYYDSEGNIIERRDYIYDGERLTKVFTFGTDGIENSLARTKLVDMDGDEDIDYEDALDDSVIGTLLEESIFEGIERREKIQQSFR